MTISEKIPIWLDCDPGNDDVFAILLAAFDPRFNLVGISTVHGNAPVEMTTHNTLGLLDLLNFEQDEVKVYSGSEAPLVNPPKFALNIHGSTGLGGASVPEDPRIHVSTDMTYLEAMRQAILKYEHKLCVVCTGTLTNISKLITAYPDLKSKIKYLPVMGGGLDIGNVTPYAEFNFNADPHAAKHVVEELGYKMILAPLNFTHTVIATPEVMRSIYDPKTSRNSPIRRFFYNILEFYAEAYKSNFGFVGPPIHDPLALFSVLPFLDYDQDYHYKYLRRKLSVVDTGEKAGQTIVINDSLDLSIEEENGVYIGVLVNTCKFWGSIMDALDAAQKRISK